MKVYIKKQIPRFRIAIIEHNGGKEISHFVRNDNFDKYEGGGGGGEGVGFARTFSSSSSL